jgi:hypothetical protein
MRKEEVNQPGFWIHIPMEGRVALYVDAEPNDEQRIWDWICASDERTNVVLAAAGCMEAAPA